MFVKKKKLNYEEGQQRFNTLAHQVGSLEFQIRHLQTIVKSRLQEMDQLEKMGQEYLAKKKKEAVMETATTPAKEEEDADESGPQIN